MYACDLALAAYTHPLLHMLFTTATNITTTITYLPWYYYDNTDITIT